MAIRDALFPPYCGSEYGIEYGDDGLPLRQTKVAGEPLVCDKPCHDEREKHLNAETGFAWW